MVEKNIGKKNRSILPKPPELEGELRKDIEKMFEKAEDGDEIDKLMAISSNGLVENYMRNGISGENFRKMCIALVETYNLRKERSDYESNNDLLESITEFWDHSELVKKRINEQTGTYFS